MKREKDKLILKPNIINVVTPRFLKHAFWNGLFFLFLYLIYIALDRILKIGYNVEIILSLIFLTLVLSLLKISKDLFMIMITSYIFHPHAVEHKTKFLREVSHTVNYNHITDVHVKKTYWDSLCGVGDIIIHTSNDHTAGGENKALVLSDVRHPDKIKDEIQRVVFNMHNPHHQ